MTEVISEELNYAPMVNNHSTVNYRAIQPQSSSTVNLQNTSVVGPVDILIPPTVFTPSKSKLNFTVNIPLTAANYNYIQGNLLTILHRITLYDTATNAVLCDVSSFDKMASMLSAPATKIDEFLNKTYSTVNTYAPYEDISRSNSDTANITLIGGTAGFDVADQTLYTGQRKFYIGAVDAALSLNVSIPFSAFKFTALATSKNIYCPSNLVLQLYFNQVNDFAFVSTSANDAFTAAAAVAAGSTITNLKVVLATEGNLSIVSQTISKVMSSGLSLPIAYPTVTRQAPAAAGTVSYQLNLTRGYGSRVLFLATSFFAANATLNTAQQHGNFIGGTWTVPVITYINTKINSVALKYPAGFSTTAGEDWAFNNKNYYDDSAVQTFGEYLYSNWTFIDSFFGEKPIADVDQHHIDGLDISSQSSTWNVEVNCSNAALQLAYYTIIVGQKMLVISNQGSQVM